MRHLLLAAVAVAALSGTAYAEGNGEPFPGVDAAVTSPAGTSMTARMQDPYHYAAPTTAIRLGSNSGVTARMQDPYHFSTPDQVVSLTSSNNPTEATASIGTPGSQAQGLVAPTATHG